MDSVNSRVFTLIVGIDKYAYDETWNLDECVNDAKLIESFITTNFATPFICRLHNEAAKRKDILDNFRSHLIENINIKPGDAIIFYFAGHGSRVTAPDGWRSNDDLIETICPYDQRVSVNGVIQGVPGIPDITIAALLRELARNCGNNITVILDCCYAGGVTRAPGESRNRSIPPENLPFPDIDKDIWTLDSSNFDTTTKRRGFGGVDCQYVLLAACGELQTASDGYFTSSLVKSLNQKPSTYADLLAMVPPKHNRSGTAVQHPQCEWNKNRLLFTTLSALDNKAFRLTKRDNGRYTVAAWAIHGVQIGMVFRVHSPPAVLRVEKILASSFTLAVQDPSTDILSGATAFAMMNLGMNVFLESDILRPDVSLIDSCFTIAPARQGADLILSLESSDSGERLRIESLDPLLHHLSCHVTHVDWNEVRDHLPRFLDAIARFRYHLGRHSDHGDPQYTPYTTSKMSTHVPDRIFSDSGSESFILDSVNQSNLKAIFFPSPIGRPDSQTRKISSMAFDFSLFYMDPSDFSIQAWHLPKPPPNPARETVRIGYGAGGGDPIEFVLEGKDYDAGFLKVFISTEYADMGSLEQDSAAAQRGMGKRVSDITGIWGAWLGAVTVTAPGDFLPHASTLAGPVEQENTDMKEDNEDKTVSVSPIQQNHHSPLSSVHPPFEDVVHGRPSADEIPTATMPTLTTDDSTSHNQITAFPTSGASEVIVDTNPTEHQLNPTTSKREARYWWSCLNFFCLGCF
ncbi:caspase domain-containing protein [Mycena metata]|uniref:Caspase domain-containing protein n=1 Tax=Mycena metata TaxID=1033252 RepID=A0AAD7H5N3_9AGAR|nr:caspase domain-containing protein [Mycena metata]